MWGADCRDLAGSRENREEAVCWSRRERMEAGPEYGGTGSRVQILHRVCGWSPQGLLQLDVGVRERGVKGNTKVLTEMG